MVKSVIGEEGSTVKSYDNLSSAKKADQILEDLDLIKMFEDKCLTYVDLNEAGEIVLHAPNGDVIKVIGEITDSRIMTTKVE